MSHNVKIDGVRVANIDILQRAINNLSAQGIQVSMHNKGTFRTWSGQPNKSDYTIHLPQARFDIGLKRGKDGTYEPVFDHMLADTSPIACAYDPKQDRGEADRVKNTMGKLMEEYSACIIEDQAERQGHSTRRQKSSTGELQVVTSFD